MSDIQIIFLLLGLNFLLTVGYFISMIIKKETKKGMMVSLYFLFCPVIGIAFLCMANILNHLFERFGKREISVEDLSFRKDKIHVISASDVKEDEDKVPLEEAFLVSDIASRRKAFLDMLKEEDNCSIEVMKHAVENKDSEISHYAASSLSDAIAKFKSREKILEANYKRSKEEEDLLSYIEYVSEFLGYKIFSMPEQKTYINRLEAYLELLQKEHKESLNGRMLSDIISLWEDAGDNLLMEEKWINEAAAICDSDVDAYKILLKYYHRKRDREKFMYYLESMKQSSLVLDAEAVDWIRFYS